MEYAKRYFEEVETIAKSIDIDVIEKMVQIIWDVKEKKGRLFFLGVGGSAANCTHAVNDFRKIGGIECYTPNDNVAELTARTNDEGWSTTFEEWLKISNLNSKDALFIFSVGGGNLDKNTSPNIVSALKYTSFIGSKIIGIVGRDGGYTAKVGDICLIIPTVNSDTITPHSETFQAIIWHLLVSHPKLKVAKKNKNQ